jgi:cysteine desulfurase
MKLDLEGYAVSTGSACSTGASRPSHVLEAMGCPGSEAIDSVRVSLGPRTTEEEILGFLDAVRRAVSSRSSGSRSAVAAVGGAR